MAHRHHLPLPTALVAACERDGRTAWLASLPVTVAALVGEWGLELGAPYEPGGQTAWVAPVRTDAGEAAVLKVLWPHFEAEHEADGLRRWDGDGAVRLLASGEREGSVALLLERCLPGSTLAERPGPEQDEVLADLLPRLWRDPGADSPFRSLQFMCDAWADGFVERDDAARSPLDAGMVRDGLTLFRALPSTAERPVLLATDLHAENVLEAEREPWLMIDPKPFVGDPTYDALQHLLNSADRVRRDPHGYPRHLAEMLGLDPERLLLWLFARCVIESAHWSELAELAPLVAP
jgi:streptomycin 6-kinase